MVAVGRMSPSRCTAGAGAVLSIKLFLNAAESELNFSVTSLASHLQMDFEEGLSFGGERREHMVDMQL